MSEQKWTAEQLADSIGSYGAASSYPEFAVAAAMLRTQSSRIAELEKANAEHSSRLIRCRELAEKGAFDDAWALSCCQDILEQLEATVVEEHRHKWTEREGDDQNLYCECGEISRPLSAVETQFPKEQ